MTEPLQLFPTHAPIGRTQDGKTVYMTTEFFKALKKVFERVGGATGASTTDLASSDDEDSGLEDYRLEQSKHNDAVDMLPPSVTLPFDDPMHPLAQQHVELQLLQSEVSGLREEVAQLRTQINDILQGTLL